MYFELISARFLIQILKKIENEAAGIPIIEFCGLRRKMYSYIKDNEKGDQKCKGVKKDVV